LSDSLAKRCYKPICSIIQIQNCNHKEALLGDHIHDTSVTTNQRDILLKALADAAELNGNVVEVGSWKGVTTVELASHSTKIVYAVDPFPKGCFPGIDEAFSHFIDRTAHFPNIQHIRLHSGRAYNQLKRYPLSFVFVDAMHDFISSFYDISLWARMLLEGGFLAMHDVDDHPGVNLAAQLMLKDKRFRIWGYCPNLLVLQRIRSV
jgi:predicted O-methyltransferase YrrM